MSSAQEWFQGKDRLNEIAAHIHPTKEEVDRRKEQNFLEEIIFSSKIFPEIPQITVSIDDFFPVVYSYATPQFLFVRPTKTGNGNSKEATNLDFQSQLKNLHQDFTEMHDEIQTEMEVVTSGELVVPIAFHPFLIKWEDDMWYRCMVYDFREDSNLVSVFLIDFGNIQDCLVSNLRLE